MQLIFHEDPGHGWIQVPRSLIEVLQIGNRISSYSYQSGNLCYLEEDDDAAVLMEACKREGIKIEFIEQSTNNDSFIRSLERFRA